MCLLWERAPERRIFRAGKAHIDDARALADRPVDALEDAKRGALGVCRSGESVHGKEPRTRRSAEESAGSFRPCHRGFSRALWCLGLPLRLGQLDCLARRALPSFGVLNLG